jgi:hypothetical protein
MGGLSPEKFGARGLGNYVTTCLWVETTENPPGCSSRRTKHTPRTPLLAHPPVRWVL